MTRSYFLLLQLFLHGVSGARPFAVSNNQGDYDVGGLEFGRNTIEEDERLADAELVFRELVADFSMSMSMSLDYNTPAPTRPPVTTTTTPSPTPSSTSSETPPLVVVSAVPTTAPSSSPLPTLPPLEIQDVTVGVGGFACDGLQRSTVRFLLDIETAPNVGAFFLALEVALMKALSVDFSLCQSNQFSGRRKLADDFHLNNVGISRATGGESCTVDSTLADTCTVVMAEFEVVGDDQNLAASDILTSLEIIFQDDQAFDTELLSQNVIDVTLHDDSDSGNSFKQSPDVRTAGGPTSGRSGVVAILSVAAGTVVLALVLRKTFKGTVAHGDKYDVDSHADTIPNTVAEQA